MVTENKKAQRLCQILTKAFNIIL